MFTRPITECPPLDLLVSIWHSAFVITYFVWDFVFKDLNIKGSFCILLGALVLFYWALAFSTQSIIARCLISISSLTGSGVIKNTNK